MRLEDGSVRCWGPFDTTGEQLTSWPHPSLTAAEAMPLALGGKATRLSASRRGNNFCALRDDGRIVCWGANVGGTLASPAGTLGQNAPPLVLSFQGNPTFVDLAISEFHSCAVTNQGQVRCWGSPNSGELGLALGANFPTLQTSDVVPDVTVGQSASAVVTSRTHSMILGGGAVRSWGSGYVHGVPGPPVFNIGETDTPSAHAAIDFGGQVALFAATEYHACVMLSGGTVECWGQTNQGAVEPLLGLAGPYNVDKSVSWIAGPTNVGQGISQLAGGTAHFCARFKSGALRCWGHGADGQLGYGSTSDVGDVITPAQAGDVPVGGNAVDVACGAQHTCVALDTGEVRCWGYNLDGELGFAYDGVSYGGVVPASAAPLLTF